MRVLTASFVLACACAGATAGGRVSSVSFEKAITVTVKLNYAVFAPERYEADAARLWPLILFLHGAGERGDDLSKVTSQPIFDYARRAAEFPFIIAAPQCPLGRQWKPDELAALLDEVQAKYRVDPDRVYLTGYSMGGSGTWATAMDYSPRFAAIAPVCGRAIPLLVGNLWRTPVWAFHGEKDNVVPISQSRTMVDFLKGLDNPEVRFTIYPEDGHDIWHKVYNDPELYEWLLRHSRQKPPADGNNTPAPDD